jgi:hypothetical protein
MTMDSLRKQLGRARRRDLWVTLAPTLLIIALAFAATL